MIFSFVVVVLAIPSDPYVRSKVRPGTATDHCLYWTENHDITWQPNQAGNPETPGDTEFDAIRASFKTWNDQFTACGNLHLVEGALTASRDIGWKKEANATNENVLLFRLKSCSDTVPLSDSCWKDDNDADDCGNKFDCWEHQAQAIALTTTTYDPQSGRIFDADVEFNAAPTATTLGFLFTTVDTPKCSPPLIPYSTSCVAWDIQNTLTHEIGHMMGLDHTANPGSTMNPTAPPGELSKRVLDLGTASYVCNVYTKGKVTKDCVIRPVSGTLGNVAGSCSVSGGGAALLGLAALLCRRKRRG